MYSFIHEQKWVAGQSVYFSRAFLSDVSLFRQKYSTPARQTGISVSMQRGFKDGIEFGVLYKKHFTKLKYTIFVSAVQLKILKFV